MDTNLVYKELEAKDKCKVYITEFYSIWERKRFEQQFFIPIAKELLRRFGVQTNDLTETKLIDLEDLIEGRK